MTDKTIDLLGTCQAIALSGNTRTITSCMILKYGMNTTMKRSIVTLPVPFKSCCCNTGQQMATGSGLPVLSGEQRVPLELRMFRAPVSFSGASVNVNKNRINREGVTIPVV